MPVTRKRLAIGALLGLLFALALLLRPATVIRHLSSLLYSPWFPVFLVGLYAIRPFLGWPITVLSALVGFRYGIVLGFPIALAGLVATSLIPYAAGRRLEVGGTLGTWFVGGSRRYFRTAGDVRGVVAARLAPTPAEPVSAAAGFGGVSVGAFVVGTLLGELPWTVAAVTVGHSLNSFSAGAAVVDWRLAIAGLVAAVVLLAGPVYRVVAPRLRGGVTRRVE